MHKLLRLIFAMLIIIFALQCNQILKIMVRKSVKQVVRAFDFFSQPVTFRYGEEPQYQSLTGGICSILLIIIFAIVFTSTIMSTFRKQSIDSKITTVQQQDPTYYQVGTDSFIFAIGLSGINLNSGKKWFDIYFEERSYSAAQRNKSTIKLSPCTRQQWTKIKPSIGEVYDRLGLDSWLCPTDGTVLQLQGKFSSNLFKFYKIGVKACNASTATVERPCATTQDINQYLNVNQAFTFNFYFLNTILNPGNQQFSTVYMDDSNYFPFSPTNGISANFFLSSYNISTDDSIYPYSMYKQKKGGISNTPTQDTNYQVKQSDFLKFYIRKSSLSLNVSRSYRKLDDTLSYIGGLLSAIITFLFILQKYNQLSYELEIAKNLYHYDRNEPLEPEGFNFFIFLAYLVYLVVQFFYPKVQWKKIKKYKRSLDEVRKQMDIRLIMKKILYSQRMAIAVFDEPKAKILHLQQPLTLEEAEEIRKDHRFYEKLQKKFFDYEKIRIQEQNQLNQISNNNNNQQNEQKLQNSFDKMQLSQISIQFPNAEGTSKKLQKQTSKNLNQKIIEKRMKTLKERYNTKKIQMKEKQIQKNTFNILNMLMNDEERKNQQLNQKIQKVKVYVKILQSEAEMGDTVSQNILSRFDPKLLRMFLLEDNKKAQAAYLKNSSNQLENYTINLASSKQVKKQSSINIPITFNSNTKI